MHVPRPQPDLPCFSVEDSLKNKDFFGRQDVLERLDQILLPSSLTASASSSTPRIQHRCFALLGIPGVGKSEVAAAYAFSRKSKFDAIFWIQADTSMKLEDGFAQIARNLNLKNCENEEAFDTVSAREEAKGWLSNPKKVVNPDRDLIAQADATWLLILDNADEPALLADYWQVFGTGSVLVTSKTPPHLFEDEINHRPLQIEELEPFDIDEGAQLIRNWTNSHEPDHIERSRLISQLFGGVPLALLQCAEMVKNDELSFGHFLNWQKRQQERRDLIDSFEAQRDNIPARGSIATRWAMNTMRPDTKAVIDVFALLDPDGIQDEILMQPLDNVDSDLLLNDFPRSMKQLVPTRKALRSQAFLKFDEGQKQQWRIHRSVQEVFRFYMDQQRLQDVFTCTVALIHNYWEPEYYKGRSHSIVRWRKYNELHNHLSSILKIYREPFSKGVLEPNQQLATLLFQCAWYV